MIALKTGLTVTVVDLNQQVCTPRRPPRLQRPTALWIFGANARATRSCTRAEPFSRSKEDALS
jgi:hypothetical protein